MLYHIGPIVPLPTFYPNFSCSKLSTLYLYLSRTSPNTSCRYSPPYKNTCHSSGCIPQSLSHYTSAGTVSCNSRHTQISGICADISFPKTLDYTYKFLTLDRNSPIARTCIFYHISYRKTRLDNRFRKIFRKLLSDRCIYRLFENIWSCFDICLYRGS